MKKIGFTLLLLASLGSRGFAQTVIPQVMSFQGYVSVDSGAYTDTVGKTIVVLALYDDSTQTTNHLVWSQPDQKVKVYRGYYSALLNLSTGWLSGVVPFSKQYWINATVLGQELSPRVQLTASPYSFVADTALHVHSSV